MVSRLPPLNAVRVFSIVAQRLNFARAAEDLGVTQSAVSKQIQLLEDYTGTKLFERKAQGVALTSEGRELREAILPAINGLAQSFERYARRPPRSTAVRVTTTASFASMALLPSLAELEHENPDIVIEMLAGDRLFDLNREEIDFAVRFGPGPWPEGTGEPLGPQTLTPVASPSLIEHYSSNEHALRRARRIQTFAKNEWASSTGVPPYSDQAGRPALILENFHVAACAARLGYGAALLPTILLGHELKQKMLAVIGDPVPWSEGFWIVTPQTRSLSAPAEKTRAWIKGLA